MYNQIKIDKDNDGTEWNIQKRFSSEGIRDAMTRLSRLAKEQKLLLCPIIGILWVF